jgi:transposase
MDEAEAFLHALQLFGKAFCELLSLRTPVDPIRCLYKGIFFFGGIFPVLIYDNLTTAVQKVYQGKKRDVHENYEKFRAYYSFEAMFCNRGAAHEKGGVEGLIGYVRCNYMVPVSTCLSNLVCVLLSEMISE